MALKDLLILMDDSPQGAARLDAAINLAAQHGSHLVGLYVLVRPHIPGYVRAELTEEILQNQAAMLRARADRAEKLFNERVGRVGISGEWRCVEDALEPTLNLHARYCDVVVLGQRDPEGEDVGSSSEMPDRSILSVGRPVLLIPSVGEYPKIGERVMVAWDGSRAATRAVNDSLPFLAAAKQVSVLAVNPRGGGEGHGEIPSADICLHLARHGIRAEAQHVFAEDLDVGDMLLSRAADQGIDLLVMGAYGHARWRELVMGGATRHILAHMTMPVLMSH
jgi:nucleotide-binding universal stress UspA family protein